jgi:spore coat protein U-like protein
LDLEPSTPYPGSTSAPGNMGTLDLGNTTALGNPGNIVSTCTLHPGSTITIDEGASMSHLVLRPKPYAHRKYAQDQVVIHTARM